MTGVDLAIPELSDKPPKQALPPSGEFGSGNMVAYSFEASLIDEYSDSEIKASKILQFSKTREVETPEPQIITIVQEKIIDRQDMILNLSSFKIALDIPKVIVQGQAFPLRLRLLHEKSHSTSSPPPMVLLNSSEIQLLENTFIQSENKTKDQWTKKYTMASRDFPSFEPESGGSGVTTGGMDLAALLHNPITPLQLAPSFECPNIQRTYGFEISLTPECGEQVFELMFALDSVTVLAAELGSVARAKQAEEARDPFDGPFPMPDYPVPRKILNPCPHMWRKHHVNSATCSAALSMYTHRV